MKNLSKYGKAPYTVVVIHGGPGAGGEMAPVARELASGWGVLEPIQTAASLEGLVVELRAVLEKNANLPVILIGFSWGAWLSYILAARCPDLLKKLILVGSWPFEDKYAKDIAEQRFRRLGEKEREEFKNIVNLLNEPTTKDKDKHLRRLGQLASKTDTYEPITNGVDKDRVSESTRCSGQIYHQVWKEASKLRASGELLELGKHIKCPVVAIHGDYDPHPAEGVQKPLSSVLKSFRFVMIGNCGHKPWIERKAREDFFRILKEELRSEY